MRLRQLGLMAAGIASFCVASCASSIPLGYVAWDVTLPGVSGEFDIVNQSGPNSSGDSTWPVTSELQFSSLALTVLLDNGDTVVLGPSYFLPNPDGESFDGSQISIGAGDPLPVVATLTGTINPTSIMLFDGAATTLPSTFNVSFSDSPNLLDGDLAIIFAQVTPEPATWLPIGAGLIGLSLLLIARGCKVRTAIIVVLTASPIAGTREARAAAWAKAGDSCATMNPGAATPWDAWMQAVAPDPRAKSAMAKTTTDWTFLAGDNTVRVTPGGPVFDSEGPYCRTIANNFGNFYLNILYQVVAGRVTPKGPKGVMTDQDFGNSGIYIFDRWEVQIIDPSQFDDPNNKPGVANGKTIKPDTRIKPRTNGNTDNQRNTLVPGSLYAADPVRSDNAKIKGDDLFLNQANPAGNWNTLEVTFCVLKADGVTPLRPPQLLSKLNGNIVYYGAVPGNGTGGRADAKAVFEGPIYLQSHWGSQVQLKNPTFDPAKVTCPLP